MYKKVGSEMKVVVKGYGDFLIKGDQITETSGQNFYAQKEKDTLTLTMDNPQSNNVGSIRNSSINIGGSSGISVVGNTVRMNGISIQIKGKEVNITGDVSKVIVNSKELETGNGIQEEMEDGRISKYIITEKIDAITVKGSGDIHIENGKMVDASLVLAIQGSGDIHFKDSGLSALVATIQGSGDIYLTSVEGNVLTATIQGSGDIINKGSSAFGNVISATQGSGDIIGLQ